MGSSVAAPAVVRTFRPGDEYGIRRVLEASLAHDALPGFEQADIERALSRIPIDPEGTLVALEHDLVVGHCIPRHDDLTVHPDHRRRGHGRRLVAAALELVRRRNLPYLMLYGPTHLAATRAFVEAVGLRYHSSLWRFLLTADTPVPEPAFPADVAVRGFAPDDLERYVVLMNAAFADHPTPLSWTVDIVRQVHALPDFDLGGILLVTPAGEPDRPIAFTRVEATRRDDGRWRGSIGLIGVLPGWRRRGLGRELLRWGVRHLRAAGADEIELDVEALNERATAIYRAAGFRPAVEWPHVILPA